MSSREGFRYTPANGLKSGLSCKGAIKPTARINQSSSSVFDVIIIGAGYAGLTASRDVSVAGLNTLLIEARDRIGGRTWTSEIEGYQYELGGTWVHWNQPHIWRELSRYGLQEKLEISQDFSRGYNNCSVTVNGISKDITHDQEVWLPGELLNVFDAFCNVDGQMGRTIIPLPHQPHYSPLAKKYEHMSAKDRIDQIANEISAEARGWLEAFILHCTGGTLENSSFFDLLRWFALCGHETKGIETHGLKYKFSCGQTGLALKFFEEAMSTGYLSYTFDTPIKAINDHKAHTQVVTRDGRVFRAKRVICTIPLNVLSTISFDPPLSAHKAEAISIGHVNQATKVHAEVSDRDMRSWTGITYPGSLLFAYGDGETPKGNTHIVFFGSELEKLQPEENINKTIAAVQRFKKMDIEQLVFHNWSKDEFANGSWCMFHPDYEFKYLPALRAAHGRILFASADTALGWRGFIDGAIDEGTRAARLVTSERAARVGKEARI